MGTGGHAPALRQRAPCSIAAKSHRQTAVGVIQSIAVDATRRTALIKKIARKYKLELLLLFGSRADGKASPDSDFDVAYLAKADLDLNREAKLITDLAPAFSSDNIDLVNLRKATPLLFYSITTQCQVMFQADDMIFPTMRAYAFKKYVETKPLRQLQYEKLKARIGLGKTK